VRSHLTTWEHLVGERGWTLDDYKERSIRSILAEVLAPPDGQWKRSLIGKVDVGSWWLKVVQLVVLLLARAFACVEALQQAAAYG
jgi:hypothetical protein